MGIIGASESASGERARWLQAGSGRGQAQGLRGQRAAAGTGRSAPRQRELSPSSGAAARAGRWCAPAQGAGATSLLPVYRQIIIIITYQAIVITCIITLL